MKSGVCLPRRAVEAGKARFAPASKHSFLSRSSFGVLLAVLVSTEGLAQTSPPTPAAGTAPTVQFDVSSCTKTKIGPFIHCMIVRPEGTFDLLIDPSKLNSLKNLK